jgi:5-formyltetrahydrofolate cyclo-ligase
MTEFLDKPAVRALLKGRIAGIALEIRREKSVQACREVIESEVFGVAKVVMVYLSTPDEIDTTLLIQAAWKLGKTVVAPKIPWKERQMIPVEIHSLDKGLTLAKLGIREPVSSDAFPVERIDLTIVPALGFCEDGHRIGHGMGFYDRFLAQGSYRGVSCGLGFEEQVLPSLPRHEHDVPLDMIITEKGIRRYRR